MATLQLLQPAVINGTTYATAQLILTPSSPSKPKTILPKQEPVSPATTPDFHMPKKAEIAKRRIHFSKKALTHPRPQSVTRRNARERNRVKQVNQGFVTLANHVPSHLRSKKMSKVDTLRAAISYIRDLRDELELSEEGLEDHQKASDSPFQMPGSLPSPATSISSSTPESPEYQTPTFCHDPRLLGHDTTYQPNYPQYTNNNNQHFTNHNQQFTPSYNYTNQQPMISPIQNDSYPCREGFIDYSHKENCPSPSSSSSSDSGFDTTGNITPEEAEILEFASWFH